MQNKTGMRALEQMRTILLAKNLDKETGNNISKMCEASLPNCETKSEVGHFLEKLVKIYPQATRAVLDIDLTNEYNS